MAMAASIERNERLGREVEEGLCSWHLSKYQAAHSESEKPWLLFKSHSSVCGRKRHDCWT